MRLAGPWPSVVATTRQPAPSQVAQVGERLLGLAAVADDLAGADRDDARRRVSLGVGVVSGGDRPPRDRRLASACSRTRASGQYDEAAGRRRSGRSADRSIGSSLPAGGVRPRRGEELLARRHQVVRPGCGPARGRRGRRGCRRAAGRAAAPSRRRARAPATPCPRRRCPRRSSAACRRRRAARSTSAAARARTASVSRISRQGGAHRPCSADLQRALVGDREPADLLDRVAPELDPQRVVLGRREDVEDAAADGELAAPLDHVDAGVGGADERLDGRPRGRRRRPAAAATGSSSPSPATSGCMTARTGATSDPDRPALAARRRGARAGAARRAGARRCRSAG